MSALILFVAAFCIVFALGFQSLNVNRGHYLSAFLTSFVIGASNLVLLKILPAQTTPLELAAYLGGGPFGIVASMWAHKRWMRSDTTRLPIVSAKVFQGDTQIFSYDRTDPDEAERLLRETR